MSGQIQRAPSTNINSTVALKRRPCEIQAITLSKSQNPIAEDQFLATKSTQGLKEAYAEENSPERPFSRRRHRRYFFRWREARNFFRRMLFAPETKANKSSIE